MHFVLPALPRSYKLLAVRRFLSTSSHALKGKKCVITGASRGIGLAIARRFASEGADTTLIGRHEDTLQKALENVKSGCGGVGTHVARVGDVAQRQFWEELQRKLKAVDILVNAAGISHTSLLVSTDPELANQVIQTNLMGTVWGCQVMVKGMIKQRSGCIINVSSLTATKAGMGCSVYAASKAGIMSLTRSLVAEIGQSNIRVNSLNPGFIETQMTEGIPPEICEQVIGAIPAKRFGTVEEVADAAYFLATNAYANNCVLNLDGGLSAT